ncbi:sodium-dependent lysophosphatidylcholine symporter 1-like isoform X2 [Sceloporus undulatus]|uniref:sodium-dependent lysophosphatidylcholine symporter 1-like isoform X2 n=1 Tax=Sceloporus undulatus TaxID=8520 RepID=UPI001C4BE1DE|nr:sodium-dependent lysophosphatidylcholine symporter 1-like isoform X2 [Sceloporus undulatus]
MGFSWQDLFREQLLLPASEAERVQLLPKSPPSGFPWSSQDSNPGLQSRSPRVKALCWLANKKVYAALPFSRKLCYAIGGAPYQLTGNALGFFFQIFLLDVVQLEPIHASLILFLGRAWDAMADPVVGTLVSRSPRRKWGKLIPWTVSAMPFGIFFYIMLWFVPSNSLSVSLKFFWHLVMYCFFQTSMSCYHVPYSSLTMFLGGSQADRDSATSYRMSVEVLSTLLGSSIQGQIVGSHHAVLRKSCNVGNSTLGNNTALLSETLENTRRAYLVASFVLGSIYCFSCFVLFLGVKERADPSSSLEKTRHSFWGNLHMLLGYKPYNRLLCGFLLASLAFQLIQGIFALFCTYVSGLAGRFQHLVLIMLVVTCLSIRIWQCFLEKFGKKTAVFVGLSLIIPALIVITVGSHSFLLYSFMVAMAGSSLAVLYLLPWSMLPDAVDDFKLRNPACLDPEPLFYSFYIFVNKFAGGLSLGISTMSLHFAGYRATDCTHNPKVMLTLQILMAPVPIALMLLAMAVFCSYPINEERRKQIKMEKEPASTWKEHSESKAIYCKHRREERNSFASCCEGEI